MHRVRGTPSFVCSRSHVRGEGRRLRSPIAAERAKPTQSTARTMLKCNLWGRFLNGRGRVRSQSASEMRKWRWRGRREGRARSATESEGASRDAPGSRPIVKSGRARPGASSSNRSISTFSVGIKRRGASWGWPMVGQSEPHVSVQSAPRRPSPPPKRTAFELDLNELAVAAAVADSVLGALCIAHP